MMMMMMMILHLLTQLVSCIVAGLQQGGEGAKGTAQCPTPFHSKPAPRQDSIPGYTNNGIIRSLNFQNGRSRL